MLLTQKTNRYKIILIMYGIAIACVKLFLMRLSMPELSILLPVQVEGYLF